MLENARAHGVDACEGVRVREVRFDADRPTGVRVQYEDGSREDVAAKVVVDASGQSAMIGNRFDLMEKDDLLKKGAVWTYWKGALRDEGRDEGATMVIQSKSKNGWFWYIPLHNDVLSVGIVRGFDEMFAGNRDHETIYNEEVEGCPEIKRRLAGATQCDRFYATKDYSYKARKWAGDGWVLLGDAHGFLDPLYSSDVRLALKSGSLAADAIADALKTGDLSGENLG